MSPRSLGRLISITSNTPCPAVDPRFDQLQNPPHPRSPSRQQPDQSYRFSPHPPNLWTVPPRQAAQQAAAAARKPMEATAEVARQATRLVAGTAKASSNTDQRSQAQASAPTFAEMFLWPWMGAMQSLQQAGGSGVARGVSSLEEVIPLGEEVLEVGKRTENRGTARIHRYVVETPVEERVTLQSERVVVERRRPVSDKVTGEILTEVTVEVVETAEVPVIEKRTRLREEIVVRTERTQHVETVRETVRRDEVEIQQPGKRQPQQLRFVAAER